MNDNLTQKVIGLAYKVHNTLGFGFSEKVYENSLMIELRKAGITAVQQGPAKVWYEGELVGDFVADIIIEDRLILELKAVTKTTKEHEVQLVNYLNATNIEVGLLINFGSSVEVKRKYRQYRPTSPEA